MLLSLKPRLISKIMLIKILEAMISVLKLDPKYSLKVLQKQHI